ncbi:hypothetical protein CC1G_07855 [Coprinopsis cinerea okayama7|uniref:HMG box domain-containing protein n=1 Tax=Coprinopsis cinerea (strain Okayama-7 / 130 / ATCC MYA-4618 / FGSC 9003) TaxID=240176 RepID=A8P427_COPC7|nr:hypothetical protein CC1G_07855 [Coprinopsis cinerea okayama7\|eukprot:XP_001838664.1 hypothetical protein CC1G_07855 [Coprinopsis cinerea okayama7\
MPKISQQQQQQNEERIPRPANAFMIFRRHLWYAVTMDRSSMPEASLCPDDMATWNQSRVCRLSGELWRSLTPARRDFFYRLANKIEAEHKLKYPNYKYTPRRKQPKAHQSRNVPRPATMEFEPTGQFPSVDNTVAASSQQTFKRSPASDEAFVLNGFHSDSGYSATNAAGSLSAHSFAPTPADMSRGYTSNMGFVIPSEPWCFAPQPSYPPSSFIIPNLEGGSTEAALEAGTPPVLKASPDSSNLDYLNYTFDNNIDDTWAFQQNTTVYPYDPDVDALFGDLSQCEPNPDMFYPPQAQAVNEPNLFYPPVNGS